MIDEMWSTLALLKYYREEFRHKAVTPKKGGVAMEHCAWMVEEMITLLTAYSADRFEDAKRLYKANRWVGFIQGVFWKEGVFTIDQMREHVISSRATVEELSNSVPPGVEH